MMKEYQTMSVIYVMMVIDRLDNNFDADAANYHNDSSDYKNGKCQK